MIRALALSLLFALGIAIAAPAIVPTTACAATETSVVQGGLPTVPWQQVARWLLKNALTILMLLEEIAHDLQNSPDPPPGGTPPAPPPTPGMLEVG